MAKSGRFSREKGKRAERLARDEINKLLGTHSRRGQQRSGRDAQDVIDHIPHTHCEVKWSESLSVYAAMVQAEADRKDDEVPWIMHKRKETPWMFTIQWNDLIALIRRVLLIKKIKPLKRRKQDGH